MRRSQWVLTIGACVWTGATLISASNPGGPDGILLLSLSATCWGLVLNNVVQAMTTVQQWNRQPAERPQIRQRFMALTAVTICVLGGYFLARGPLPFQIRFRLSEPALTAYVRGGSNASWAGLFPVERVERQVGSVWLHTGTDWSAETGLVFCPMGKPPAFHSEDSDTTTLPITGNWYVWSRAIRFPD